MTFSKKSKVLAIASGILLLSIVLDFFITKAIYDSVFPRYDGENCSTEYTHEGASGVEFKSGEETLSGLLYDSPGDSLIVIAGGINSCMADVIPYAEAFFLQEKDVFIFDMTGVCQSSGESSVGFSRVAYDLDCALDFISESYEYDKIFLLGYSRGGYSVCCQLSERTDITAIAAVSSPNSAMEATVFPVYEKIGFLAYGNYPMLWLYQSMLFDCSTVSASTADIIEKSSVPTLVIQGRDDSTVPADECSLFSHRDSVSRADAEFLLLSGDHTSVWYGDDNEGINEELFLILLEFFENNGGE